MRDFSAVLCDLDGTLIESEDLHFEAWVILLGRHGHVAGQGWNNRFIGLPDVDAVAGLKAEFPDMAHLDNLLEEKQVIFRDLITKRGKALVYPGVPERLEEFRRAGVKLAVGTNSIIKNTRLCLEVGGIGHFFESIAALDTVPRGKPEPDIYLAAAAGLGIEPGRCLVIEDSVAGIESGKAAGCTVVGVTTTWPAERIAMAHRVFASTTEAMDWALGKGAR